MITKPSLYGTNFNINRYIAIDTDAVAYLTAITNEGITVTGLWQFAADRLFADLKGKANPFYSNINQLSEIYGLYPIMGAASAAHKYNAKDPRNLDAAYRIVWNGSPTHTATGVSFNGTTQYGDTRFPLSAFNEDDCSMTYYSRTDIESVSQHDMGYYSGGPAIPSFNMVIRYPINTLVSASYHSGSNLLNGIVTDSRGMFTVSRTSAIDARSFKNGIQIGSISTKTSSIVGINNTIFVGGAGFTRSTRQCAFAVIGKGRTPAKELALYNAVQTFQTILSRQV